LGPLITDTAVPIDLGGFSIQPLAQFGFRGGQFSANWRRVSSRGNFYSLQVPVQFTYGPFPNVETYLIVPYLHNWANDAALPSSPGTGAAASGGLGDATLYVKYQFQEDTGVLPTCTALAGFGFPTGHHRHFNPQKLGTDQLGGGAYTFTPGLNLSKWLCPVYLYANLWYSMHTTAYVNGKYINPRDQITLNLAAQWFFTPRWSLILECYNNWQAGKLLAPASHETTQALMSLAMEWEYNINAHWSIAGGLAVDVAGKNSGYNYTPLLSCQYTF